MEKRDSQLFEKISRLAHAACTSRPQEINGADIRLAKIIAKIEEYRSLLSEKIEPVSFLYGDKIKELAIENYNTYMEESGNSTKQLTLKKMNYLIENNRRLESIEDTILEQSTIIGQTTTSRRQVNPTDRLNSPREARRSLTRTSSYNSL